MRGRDERNEAEADPVLADGRRLREFYESSEVYEGCLARRGPERFRDYVDLVASHAHLRDPVLDAGCGVGQALGLLRQHGLAAVGVDVAERFLRPARAAGLPVAKADIARLPFKDGQFQVIGCYEVAEHLTDIESACREMLRALRPGGILCITVTNYFTVTRVRERAYRERRRGSRLPVVLLIPLEALRGVWQSLRAVLARRPRLVYVPPILGDQWHHEDDVVFASHPIAVCRLLERLGCEVELRPNPSDTPLKRLARRVLWHFGPGYWVLATKPGRETTGH